MKIVNIPEGHDPLLEGIKYRRSCGDYVIAIKEQQGCCSFAEWYVGPQDIILRDGEYHIISGLRG